jgi:hypothetical protein
MQAVFVLQSFSSNVINSDIGFDLAPNADHNTVFVVDNFDGTIFQELHKHHCRIVGPPVITWCAMYGEVGKHWSIIS